MTHAITRIISFLILALFLALGKVSIIIFCFVLTAIIYLIDPPENFSNLFQAIFRMKWFFLSILIVHLFINHGNNYIFQLIEGLKRIIILVVMLLMVSWLINKTPRNQIISAIITLLSPLKLLGFPIGKMALRVELVFQNIDHVQTFVSYRKDKLQQGKKNIHEIGKSISGMFFDMIDVIDEKPIHEIIIERHSPASLLDWLLPVFIFTVLFLVQNFL